MNKEKLQLTYIGEDDWNRPMYKDQNENLWKDIECGDFEIPVLYASSNNDVDGEPDSPILQEFEIVKAKEPNPKRFDYMMLGRLQSDCEYFLGTRIRRRNANEIITQMKEIWHSFTEEEKPEWITLEKIESYEKQFATSEI